MAGPKALLDVGRTLADEVNALEFSAPVVHRYNPLDYAWEPFSLYLRRYGSGPKDVLLLGMNPGPFGMAQTGIPFGDVSMVRDWLGIEGRLKAVDEHPKRPILGFSCPRGEVSGARLWGWARDRFDAPEHFFSRFFVWNYCPLSFMEESGRNYTPDKLKAEERKVLFETCDKALASVVDILKVKQVVGVGRFAALRAEQALGTSGVAVGQIPHPSPANPAANRGWAEMADRAFAELGIEMEVPTRAKHEGSQSSR